MQNTKIRLSWVVIGLVVLLLYACVWRDPIFQLGLELNRISNFTFINGFFGAIKLPPTATADEIVAQSVPEESVFGGKINTYKIIEVRKILIFQGNFQGTSPVYSAALIKTNLGKEIFLYRYESTPNHWWVKVYPAP
jgi:hypothetical protein